MKTHLAALLWPRFLSGLPGFCIWGDQTRSTLYAKLKPFLKCAKNDCHIPKYIWTTEIYSRYGN
jgi:hypothetical protein